jgi:hypothetical protein
MSDEVREFKESLPPEFYNSAPYNHVFDGKIVADFSVKAAHEAAMTAHYAAVYGHDAVKDRDGNYVQQGLGSKNHESANHFAAILRYQGREHYNRAVKEIFARDPERAKKLGLEMPRASA